MLYQTNKVCASPQGLQGGDQGTRKVECAIWGGREHGIFHSIPNLDPPPFPHVPSSLGSQVAKELGECKSLHSQVMVQGSGTTDQPVIYEGVGEEVMIMVGGVLVSKFLVQRL